MVADHAFGGDHGASIEFHGTILELGVAFHCPDADYVAVLSRHGDCLAWGNDSRPVEAWRV
jgi:hypothetical protein